MINFSFNTSQDNMSSLSKNQRQETPEHSKSESTTKSVLDFFDEPLSDEDLSSEGK